MDGFPGEWQIKDFVIAVLGLLVIAGTDLADRRAAAERENALKMKVETLEKECER